MSIAIPSITMISDLDPLKGARIDIGSTRSLQTLLQDSTDVEVPDLKGLIKKRQLAALVEYRPENATDAAQVCLEMAQTHPQEVTVLLWNPKIAAQAMAMLHDGLQDFALEAPMALVRAILNAGHPMDEKDQQWPKTVRELLRRRQDVRTEHWALKSKKFREKKPKEPLKVFPMRVPFPYYSLSEAKSTENLNGLLGEVGREYLCRHLSEAIQDDPKSFLKRISQRDVSLLDYNTLHQRQRKRRIERGRRTVQFTPENFGRLLTRVAGLMPSGESRSHAVYYLSERRDGFSHEMRVFLKKGFSTSHGQVADHPMDLKVSFYDPNVTGDMKHLRELPEDLGRLSLTDFGTEKVDILGLELDDEGLAQALGGQFIESEKNNKNTYLQLGRLLHALASGNLPEMRRAAILVQQGRGFKSLNSRVKQLVEAFAFALQDGHAPEIRELAKSTSLLAALENSALEALVLAKNRKGGRGLSLAIKFGYDEVVAAFGELLVAVEHRLEPTVLKHAILVFDNGCLGEAIRGRHHKTIQACGQLLLRFQKKLGEFAVKSCLFAGDRSRGGAYLRIALETNESTSIRLYGEVVQALDLRPSSRAELFWEPTGLEAAINQGHGEAFMAYLDVVIALQPQLEDRGLSLWQQVHSACMKRFFCLPCLWVKRAGYQTLLVKHPQIQAQLDKMRCKLKR